MWMVRDGAGRSRCRCEISLMVLFFEKCFGQCQVPGPRDFDISFRAPNDRNGMAEPLNKARFIRAVVFVLQGSIECLFQDFRAEHLRCLSKDQVLSSQS